MNSRLNGLAATKSACADSELARPSVACRRAVTYVLEGALR